MTIEVPDPVYRGRFAPSPTGPLHLGSLLAAMGSYLEACRHGGQWLVRMEDLDPPREVPGAADQILRSLEAHGFEWHGAVIFQSARSEQYSQAISRLQAAGLLFACRCSRRELASLADQPSAGPVYPGTCRGRNLADRPGRALRFRVPARQLCFDDGLQGRNCSDLTHDCGDFVVRRRDGLIAYQLAVVVDDADQGISHVVRGADLLDSTARQVALQEALGLPTPAYMHLPLIVGNDGQKLSKQNGAVGLDDRQALANLTRVFSCLMPQTRALPTFSGTTEFWAWARDRWNPSALKGRLALESSALAMA